LDLSWLGAMTSRGLDHFLTRSGAKLRRLVLNRCAALDDAALKAVALRAPCLRELDLTFCSAITDRGIAFLAGKESRCFRARREGGGGDEDGAAGSTPSGSSSHRRHSQTHHTSSERGHNSSELHHPGLQMLTLRWCRQLTNESIRLLMEPPAANAVEENDDAEEGAHTRNAAQPNPARAQKDQLTDGFCLAANTPNSIVTAAAAGPLKQQQQRHRPSSNSLTSLNVDHCGLLTDASFLLLSKHAVHLRSLSAIYCQNLTSAALRYLAVGRTESLSHLVLDHCDAMAPLLLHPSARSVGTLRTLVYGCNGGAGGLAHLRVLRWRTCTHAAQTRTRHLEVEAECSNGYAGPARTSSTTSPPMMHGSNSQLASAAEEDGNVLAWLR
jgi:hypothetical protein